MPKPGGCHPSGISLGDVLRLPKRHPAWRRREAQSGSCMERENLAGDAKGKGTSGSNREAESTDVPERGGLLRETRGEIPRVYSAIATNRCALNFRSLLGALRTWMGERPSLRPARMTPS